MKYSDHQAMIPYSSDRPTIQPWRYSVTQKTVRIAALALTGVDAVISYKGLMDVGFGQFEAFTGAAFVLVTQAGVAIALSSGQPIAKRYQARFFEGEGPMGVAARIFGGALLVGLASMYLLDLGSNYFAFASGADLTTGGGVMRSVLAAALAIMFCFGDELLALVADELSVGAALNRVAYRQQVYHAEAQQAYQSAYNSKAQRSAKEMGKEHGQHWRPGNQHPPKGKGKPQDDGPSFSQH